MGRHADAHRSLTGTHPAHPRHVTNEDDEEAADVASGRAGLETQLRALEAFVARSEASGDELPPEAVEMIARLREIVHALNGLTSSMGNAEQPPPDAGGAPNTQ